MKKEDNFLIFLKIIVIQLSFHIQTEVYGSNILDIWIYFVPELQEPSSIMLL